MTDADVRRPVPAWIWGGALLTFSAIVPTLGGFGGPLGGTNPVPMWLSIVAFAGAMLVFALGLRGQGSVVARRPLGLVALILVGTLLPAFDVVTSLVFVIDPANPTGIPDWTGAAQVVSSLGYAAWGGAALVAGVEIARARVVPGRWRWAPLAALGVLAVVFAATQIIGVSAGARASIEVALGLLAASGTVRVLVPLVLGIAALALGARGRPAAAAQVYPPVA